MRTLASLLLLPLLSSFPVACAVETAPHAEVDEAAPRTDAPRPPVAHEAAREGLPTPILFCLGDSLPIGPVTCSPFNTMYATTPDNSYASTCQGQAVVEFQTPLCSNVPANYTWDVIPGGFAALQTGYSELPPNQCQETYVDTTLWTQSASTGTWKQVSKGRAYGRYEWGRCNVPAPESQIVPTADLGAMEISADAYEPAYWGNLFLGMYAVPLTIRVSPPG
jgi:hypothetical protein